MSALVILTLAAKRDQVVAAAWAFHNKILGSKVQVIAQFGDNSNEAQSVKRKKKSEYARRGSQGSKKKKPTE